jgi:hypothetical protein
MKKLFTTILLFGLVLSRQEIIAATRSAEVRAQNYPKIWEKAGPRERLKAARAAELDADRLLVERIYGAQIDSQTTVADLAMKDDSIAGTARASLIGATTIGNPDYFEDGRVEVVKAVKLEQVIETIRRKSKEKILANGKTELVDFDEKKEFSTTTKVLEVMGNAALPGSLGHQKIMAKRAAELDAYRRLAQRLMSIRIDSQTTVRDACMESDDLVGVISRLVKGAEPIAIRHIDDGTCEVDMQIAKGDIVREVSKFDAGRKHTTRIEDAIQESLYIETGYGTMHPPQDAGDSLVLAENSLPAATSTISSKPSNDVFFETDTIIRRLLEPKPVQR